MSIEVRNVRKTFGDQVALQDLSIAAPTGKLVALLGPSGSGKTTLLRIIAGLDFPDSGTVHLHGEDATGRRARDRGVGFVFQHYALFRHMTVFENVAFGLRVRPRRERPSSGRVRRGGAPARPRVEGARATEARRRGRAARRRAHSPARRRRTHVQP